MILRLPVSCIYICENMVYICCIYVYINKVYFSNYTSSALSLKRDAPERNEEKERKTMHI